MRQRRKKDELWKQGYGRETGKGKGFNGVRAVFCIDSSWRIYKNCDTGGRWQHEFYPSVVFVLLAGLLLGSKRAFLSVSTYLLIGLMGIPVLPGEADRPICSVPPSAFCLVLHWQHMPWGKSVSGCIPPNQVHGYLRQRLGMWFIMEWVFSIFIL